MRIGYGRVSTDDQNFALQQDALLRAGCSRIFEDHGISGRRADRPELKKALSVLEPGDVLVVWRLDRLGRSLAHLIDVMSELERRGIGFCSLTEAIDTTTPGGKLIFHIMGALAEFERELISQRTKAGIEAARARGKRPGRPPSLTPEQVAHARVEVAAERSTITALASIYGVTPLTLSRAMHRD